MTENISYRSLHGVYEGLATSDGAGVQLTRVIGQPKLPDLDPFLLLDHFHSDRADDYIAGFPPHPHRGFETVTYLLEGRMRHKDSSGHEGVIETGGIQWMTAGRGIIHSEMPEQENGLLSGFQLWINLPASHKMTPAAYQEYGRSALPVEERPDGIQVKVIAGSTSQGTAAPVQQPLTDARYFDVSLPSDSHFLEPLPSDHTVMVYALEGELEVGAERHPLKPDQLGILQSGDQVSIHSTSASRFLLIAGRPLKEPIARGGPFVMNTREEIQQAFEDYEKGRLTG